MSKGIFKKPIKPKIKKAAIRLGIIPIKDNFNERTETKTQKNSNHNET